MANTYDRLIEIDGWRNAIIKVSGVLDTSDADLSPVLALSELVNNETRAGKLVGLGLRHIWHSIGNGIELIVFWSNANRANDEQCVAVAGRGRESFTYSGGLNPRQDANGYVGDINLRTNGYGQNVGQQPIQNFTVQLEFVKLYRNA